MWRNHIAWFFLLILLILGLAFWNIIKQQPVTSGINSSISQNNELKLPSQTVIFSTDPVLGANNANNVIIEFGDFECTYCAQTSSIIKKVIDDNPEKVKLIWKDFPIPSHSNAQPAAEAAQCAARQGKFWQYHDTLFIKQGNFNEATYLSMAGDTGLNFEKFSECLKKHETLPLIERNIAEGNSIGVDGTPYFIINGQVFNGIITEEQIVSLLQ